jgi:predicted dehydrogenase
VEEILNDPEIEAVAVETEEIYLTKYARMVANAGKHLHMEKPGGIDIAEFEALIEALRSKNLTFSTGYMYRFNPKIKQAIAKVQRGELGEIYSVEAHMDCKHTVKTRQWLGTFPGGMMFFLGCHLIDLIYRIQGEPE